jgi:hypothetical protein
MNVLSRIWLIPLLFLPAFSSTVALAQADDAEWAPTPPRLSYIDGEVSHWRPGAEDWASARPNLALAEGDALYTGDDSNLEVQFGSRSFVRADENSQLALVAQEPHRIQFKVTSGLASFDLRSMEVGDTLEVSTPNALFLIEHPGYYRVEVDSRETHFITRRGGEASVVTADGRSLSIYPSEDIVVTAGNPVQVATYAAPAPDAWDRWNDERSDRVGESVSARYLPPGVYGAEELDYYGHWRVVPTYGSVWIPYGVPVGWVPYSTGHWVWDPYYEWTWVDEAPWGWAPFHYGRWAYIDGYWAWAPGPLVRRPLYSPALVGFLIRDGDVSVRLSIGLPGLWWVALSWGEPVIPWWGPRHHRGHPWWGGWGGPRIVNNVVVRQTTIINVRDIHFHNATLPRAILTVPADKFGRERVRATVETRYRHTDFAPVRGDLPVKPTRAHLYGGAPKSVQPPREIVTRPVVSTRTPRERTQPLQDAIPRARQAVPESRYVIPPAGRAENRRALPRPPFGEDAGPERPPPPRPPRYEDIRRAGPPAAAPRSQTPREAATERRQATTREQMTEGRETRTAPTPPPVSRSQTPTREPATERRQATTREQMTERPEARTAPPPAPVSRNQTTTREPATERRQARPATPPPAAARSPATREAPIERREVRPAARPAQPSMAEPPAGRPSAPGSAQAPRARTEAAQQPGETRQERPLPGRPASQTHRGRDRENRNVR